MVRGSTSKSARIPVVACDKCGLRNRISQYSCGEPVCPIRLTLDRFVGTKEFAAIVGVSTGYLSSLLRKDGDAPTPYQRLAMGPIWEVRAAMEYAQKRKA